MDDFIFKVPKLPEDVSFHKRKTNNLIKSKSDNENWNFRGECRKPFQAPLSHRCNRVGSQLELQTLREEVQENLPQPSTSQRQKELQLTTNKFGGFPNSINRFDHYSFKANSFNESRSHFVNATVGNNHSVFNSVNLPRLFHSGLGGRVQGNGSNSSSLYNNNCSSVMSSCIKNSSHKKLEMSKSMNSGNFFQQSWYRGEANLLEPSQSSLSMRKSVFSTDGFPRKCGVQRDISTCRRTNQNAFDSLTRTSSIRRDSHFSLNTTQCVADNQSFMKSVFQMSMVSMKEEIMNKLENLGHSLLKSAPQMEGSFAQTAKDIKSILEKSICINPVLSTIGLSSLSYTTGVSGCPQQSVLHGETNRQQCEPFKKPSSILQNLSLKENNNPKCEFIKSFSMKRRKEKNINYEDVSFEASTITENLNSTSKKLDYQKEVNLKNWYPVVQKKGLAFIGFNDENVEIETETIKKRINNRRVVLENGAYCNLIGNPSTDKKFPKPISTKIKNGLHANWRVLTATIEKFQMSIQRDNCEIMEGDVSTTTEFEASLNSTVMTRRTAKLLKISNVENRKVQGKDSINSFTLPKAQKLIINSTDKQDIKHKSHGKKSKIENIGRKRSQSPVEKRPVKIQKTDTPKGVSMEEPGIRNKETDCVLSITRSGRVVKRPKDIFLGSSFPGSDTCNTQRKSKVEESNQKQTKENYPTISEKVTLQKEKPEVRVSKEPADMCKSQVATKTKRKTTKKVTSKFELNDKSHSKGNDNPWGNDIDGLDDICLPNISIHHEEVTSDPQKLKLLTTETPPLKNIRSNLTFLENYTPVQSPDWQVSRHTRSAVKKFEKLRAQAFKTKIPKENGAKRNKKSKNPVRNNKDVETFVNWFSEREIRSPKQCSNVINYLMPKRSEQEDEEDSGDEMNAEEAM